MKESSIVIIGAGMAGFGAAYRLSQEGIKPTLFDKRANYGGHTSSHLYDDGFLFDEGPHVSFTSNERIQKLFADNVNSEYERIKTYANNYWQGHWIKHPAPVNLHGLPSGLVVDCINDFIEASNIEESEINNYEDWLLASYGPTFANTFPIEYTKKYHTTEAKNMTAEWVGQRLYRPDIKEVLHGALHEETPDVHYIDKFRYPTHGGFVSYMKPFPQYVNAHYDSNITIIDPIKKVLTFEGGNAASYGHLISSVPLPRLIDMIEGVPADVLEAANKLSCSQVVLVNIGLNRGNITPAQWTYIYDEDIVFTRLSYPHMLSPNTVPKGCSSIQAEVYFSDKYKPMTGVPADYIEPVISDLIKIGLVESYEEIVHKSVIYAPWANIIFDLDRPAAVAIVRAYLEEIGIESCGRYGSWGYIWTDQSFVGGENAANKVIERL